MRQLNEKILKIIHEWDPYRTEQFSNDAEAADVIQLVHSGLNIEKLSVEIKKVYDHSFEGDLPLSKCRNLAEKVHELFMNSSC
ncbi:DUF1871 family protein [Lottiidibacillus patelloidae]|nr:DUF1871 family protein [Lottiidibacillus patelloidae]